MHSVKSLVPDWPKIANEATEANLLPHEKEGLEQLVSVRSHADGTKVFGILRRQLKIERDLILC